jgi:hypothetical protein
MWEKVAERHKYHSIVFYKLDGKMYGVYWNGVYVWKDGRSSKKAPEKST